MADENLTVRLWDVIHDARSTPSGHAPTSAIVAAVLPIIAAEVQAAKAEALREAAEDLFYDGDQDVPIEGNALLHSRADEYETGGQR